MHFQIWEYLIETQTFVHCGDYAHLIWLLLGGVASFLINNWFSNYVYAELFVMVKTGFGLGSWALVDYLRW